ncbi:MAG: 30S ribosomal protein S20 [Cyanobacteria bacterium P01_H01_bin.74]
MPRIKSAKKRVLVSERNRLRNKAIKSAYRSALKKLLEADTTDARTAALNAFYSRIDRAVVKGVVHKNTAARYKSRVTLRIQQKNNPETAA